MCKEGLLNKDYKVLDKGFIRVVDMMGDDAAIVQAARVSYGEGTKTVRDDAKLIAYLLRNWHTSPFEMVEIKLHIKMPIFVMRQWARQRTASINEYSARYSIIKDDFYEPSPERLKRQHKSNKQASSDIELSEDDKECFTHAYRNVIHSAKLIYNTAVENMGLARELARIVIPLSNYTEVYWKIDLNNLLKLIEQRTHSHAQWEIQQYANVLLDIIKQWCPATYNAFVNYRLNAINLTAYEITALQKNGNICVDELKQIFPTKREFVEFTEKCELLNIKIADIK